MTKEYHRTIADAKPQCLVAIAATIPYRSGLSIHLARTRMLSPVRIAIASDHAALEMKSALAAYLREAGHDVRDLGPHDGASVDYPDYGYKLADAIAAGEAERGVAICGSGIGISIAVNRNPACRAALVSEPLSAKLSREHNDANVIALGARLTGLDMAKACVDAFLSTPFEGDRHVRRVTKLSHPHFAKEPV